MARLNKVYNPTPEAAREFFDWEVIKTPITSTVTNEVIEGFSEFRRKSKDGSTHFIHVTNTTYNPAQPVVAYDKTVEALNTLKLNYKVDGVGTYNGNKNIFAQFQIDGKSNFTVNGKDYSGLLTMAKGNDESIPISVWLTIVCIVCQNTFRAALRARNKTEQNQGISVSIRQTKNSDEKVTNLDKQIVALFEVQETVAQTLQKMAQTPVTLSQAERAFLGLLKPVDGAKVDLSDAGKTRLSNQLERYLGAFKSSPGANGQTREDWLSAVTYVDTHGNTQSKRFDAEKQFVSSEFGTYADRKENAFALASNDVSFAQLVETGDSIMANLLKKPLVISEPISEFAKLLEKA